MAATTTRTPPGRAASFGIVVGVYVVAVAVFPVVAVTMDAHPLTEVLVADLVATLLVFASSVATNNTSMYDAYWSVIPPAVVATLLVQSETGVVGTRQTLVMVAVLLWAIRLTANWARGWPGLVHEDWRYVKARDNGAPYWLQSFFGFHLFPTVVVFACLVAAEPAVRTSTAPLGWLDVVAFVVMLAGTGLELVADEQLRGFNRTKAPGDICTVGLWGWCRHPNYLGEMTFWWGLWLAGLAADPSWWWTVVGPVAITAMFLFASIPMIDERGVERRPGYAEHMAGTTAIIPRRPRTSGEPSSPHGAAP